MGALSAFRELPKDLKILFSVTLVFRSATMALPFLGAFVVAAKIPHAESQAAALLVVSGLGALSADIVAAPLIRRLSNKVVTISALLANSLAVLLFPATLHSGWMYLCAFIWGVAYEMYTPASYERTVRNVEPEARKVAFSLHRLAINIGMAVGPALGGILFSFSPLYLFWVNSAIVFLAAVVSWPLSGNLASTSESEVDKPVQNASSPSRYFRRIDASVAFAWVVALPIHLAFALPPAYLSYYVIQGRGLSSEWVGYVFTLNATLVVLFEVVLNVRTSHLSSATCFVIGSVLASLGLLTTGIASTGPVILVGTILWTFAEMMVFPALMEHFGEISSSDDVASNMGIYSAGVSIGVLLAPPFSFWMASSNLALGPWLISSAMVALACISVACAVRVGRLWTHPQVR